MRGVWLFTVNCLMLNTRWSHIVICKGDMSDALNGSNVAGMTHEWTKTVMVLMMMMMKMMMTMVMLMRMLAVMMMMIDDDGNDDDDQHHTHQYHHDDDDNEDGDDRDYDDDHLNHGSDTDGDDDFLILAHFSLFYPVVRKENQEASRWIQEKTSTINACTAEPVRNRRERYYGLGWGCNVS